MILIKSTARLALADLLVQITTLHVKCAIVCNYTRIDGKLGRLDLMMVSA